MKCDFCVRSVPKKCINIFEAIRCQGDRAAKNREKLEELEVAALAYYDSVESTMEPLAHGITSEEGKVHEEAKRKLEEMLGAGEEVDGNKCQ